LFSATPDGMAIFKPAGAIKKKVAAMPRKRIFEKSISPLGLPSSHGSQASERDSQEALLTYVTPNNPEEVSSHELKRISK
jgi:hypothetical protein